MTYVSDSEAAERAIARGFVDVGRELDLLAGIRTGDWLDAQSFPPLRFAIPGLIVEGCSLFVGPPKAGKSWWVLDAALALSSGGLAFGAIPPTEPRDVLLLALEDGDRRLQDRCRKLLGVEPIPKRLAYLTRTLPGRVVDTVSAWLDQADDPGLVVIDTLGRFMPLAMPGESPYQRDYRVGAQLKRLADERPGLSLLINHHDRKAESADFVDAVSGTQGLAGAMDTICVLSRDRQQTEGTVKVTGRDVREAAYAFTMVDGYAWQLHGGSLDAAAKQADVVAASKGLADRSLDILAYVAQRPDGVRASEVEREFGADTRRYLARMTEAGRLARPKRGLYTVSPQSQRPNLTLVDGTRDVWDTGSEVDE